MEQRAARGCGGGGGLGLAAGVLCAAALAHVVPSLTQVTATDADSGSFGSLSYSMGSGIGSVVPTQFSIDKHTGQLCTVQPLDRDEGTSAYDFTITAVDGVSAGEAVGTQYCWPGSAQGCTVLAPALCSVSDLALPQGGLNSMVYVKVFLEDINDNRPVFYPLEYAASISTQSMPGTAVLRVTAHDKDEGLNGKVTYRIVLGNSPPLFSLHKETGESTGAASAGSAGAAAAGGCKSQPEGHCSPISAVPLATRICLFLSLTHLPPQLLEPLAAPSPAQSLTSCVISLLCSLFVLSFPLSSFPVSDPPGCSSCMLLAPAVILYPARCLVPALLVPLLPCCTRSCFSPCICISLALLWPPNPAQVLLGRAWCQGQHRTMSGAQHRHRDLRTGPQVPERDWDETGPPAILCGAVRDGPPILHLLPGPSHSPDPTRCPMSHTGSPPLEALLPPFPLSRPVLGLFSPSSYHCLAWGWA